MRDVSRIDPVDMLVVRGAESTDDLQALGLPMARQYQQAESVVLVSDQGRARVVKGPTARVTFVDASAKPEALGRTMTRIFDAYRDRHPDEQHLAHLFVGKFLFYCVGGRMPNLIPVIDLLREGNIEQFEQAAELYIDSDFDEHMLASGILEGQDGPGASRGDAQPDVSSASIPGETRIGPAA